MNKKSSTEQLIQTLNGSKGDITPNAQSFRKTIFQKIMPTPWDFNTLPLTEAFFMNITGIEEEGINKLREEFYQLINEARQNCLMGLGVLEERLREEDSNRSANDALPEELKLFSEFGSLGKVEAALLASLAGIEGFKNVPMQSAEPENLLLKGKNFLDKLIGLNKNTPSKINISEPSPASIYRQKAFEKIVLLGEDKGYFSLLPSRLQLSSVYNNSHENGFERVYWERKYKLLSHYRFRLENGLLSGLMGVGLDADDEIRKSFLSVINNMSPHDAMRIRKLIVKSLEGFNSSEVNKMRDRL